MALASPSNSAQEKTKSEKLISFSVALRNNLLLIAGFTITLFLLMKKISILPICASPVAGALSLAFILCLSLQFIWRLFHKPFRELGDINLKIVTIPNKLVANFFDNLHFWLISDRAVWILTIVLGIVFWLLGMSPSSPIKISEELPLIESFSVYYYPNGTTLTQMPGSEIQIAYNQNVRVEAVDLQPTNTICEWFTTLGTLQPGTKCSTLYTAPLTGNIDTLTVHVQSFCKTQSSYSSLHIKLFQP